MADVFLSYAREDRIRAKTLAAALEAEGLSVWWDTALAPGRRFSDVIDHELQGAKAVIVAWTRASVGSDWVREEAAEALKRDILVPVRLEDVQPPLGFRHVAHTSSLVGWGGERSHPEFQSIAAECKRLAGLSFPAVVAPPHVGPPTPVHATSVAEHRTQVPAPPTGKVTLGFEARSDIPAPEFARLPISPTGTTDIEIPSSRGPSVRASDVRSLGITSTPARVRYPWGWLQLASVIVLGALTAVATTTDALATTMALAFGTLQGLTAYLPVTLSPHWELLRLALPVRYVTSSTVLFAKIGCLCAVAVHAGSVLWQHTRACSKPAAIRMWLIGNAAVASAPTLLGLYVLPRRWTSNLVGSAANAFGEICGAVLIVVMARIVRARRRSVARDITVGENLRDRLTIARAIQVGFGQALCVPFPGLGRATCAILSGQLVGLSVRAATEFSLLLGLISGTATVLSAALRPQGAPSELAPSLAALVASFVAAWAAIGMLLGYLKTRDLEAFGWYRMVIEAVFLFVVVH